MYPEGTILVYNGSDPIAALIRVFSGEGWTHCAWALGDGTAIQETGLAGVTIAPEKQTEPTAAFAYPGDVAFVTAELKKRLGDRYDFVRLFAEPIWSLSRLFGLFPRGLIRLRTDDDSWNCATFLAEPMRRDPKLPSTMADPLALLWMKPLSAIVPQDFAVMFGANRLPA